MNRSIFYAAALFACSTAHPPPSAPSVQQSAPLSAPTLKGIETADLDRSAKPCDDFYQFATGAWHAANPIPPSMDRWSRRWKAGEQNKEKLRDILEELSHGHWPEGTVEQLVADHYASCMDEKKIDAAGVSPLKPLFAEIDRVKDVKGVQRMIRRLHELGIRAPFGLREWPDWHQPSRVIGAVFASGLGLPDRDYYVRTELRFVEARDKYRLHVQKMLELAGRAKPKTTADAILSLETRLAKVSLERAARRNPKNIDHLMTFEELQALAPALD
jgi:endothelin-converting enzyme/putative endopeptidase